MGRSVVSGGVEWSDRGVECVDCGGGLGGGGMLQKGRRHTSRCSAPLTLVHTPILLMCQGVQILYCAQAQ